MQPRVREVLEYYNKGGLLSAELYLNLPGMEVDPSSWCGYIKKSLKEGHLLSVAEEINSINQKFNFYKNVSKEKGSNSGTRTVDGKGNKNTEG